MRPQLHVVHPGSLLDTSVSGFLSGAPGSLKGARYVEDACYVFSATGTTARTAKALAAELGADLSEIKPAASYTAADLNWNDDGSRSSRGANDASARPELAAAPGDMSGYDTILVGFPIWWYVAPKLLDTWVEAAAPQLAGKRVVTWATSGGSGMGRTTAVLAKLAPAANWVDGKVLRGDRDARAWAAGLGL